MVSRHEAALSAVTAMVGHHDLAPPATALVPVAGAEVEAGLRARRIDALAFVVAPTSREATELTRAAARGAGGKLDVIAVDEAEALAPATPALTQAAIPAGSLGGRPKHPDEDVATVAVSHRLMARGDLDRMAMSQVAQYLFQMRSRIAQGAPSVNVMKAPDTNTNTTAALADANLGWALSARMRAGIAVCSSRRSSGVNVSG